MSTETKTAYTKSPWAARPQRNATGAWWVVAEPPKTTQTHAGYVAQCVSRGDEENEANARLIAAAPDLLDALRAFCGDYESTSERIPEIQAAYLHALEVIAKAEATT